MPGRSPDVSPMPAAPIRRSPARRVVELVVGWAALVATPIVGVLPGPGGVFVFGFGATLVLRNSAWARRFYVRRLARWPRIKRAADWALRREAQRRKRQVARHGDAD